MHLSAFYSSFRTKEEAVTYPQYLLLFRLASKRLWNLERVLNLVMRCWEYKFIVVVTFHKCQQHPSQSSLWLMSPVYVFWVLVLQKTSPCYYVTRSCMKFFPRGVKLSLKSYIAEYQNTIKINRQRLMVVYLRCEVETLLVRTPYETSFYSQNVGTSEGVDLRKMTMSTSIL